MSGEKDVLAEAKRLDREAMSKFVPIYRQFLAARQRAEAHALNILDDPGAEEELKSQAASFLMDMELRQAAAITQIITGLAQEVAGHLSDEEALAIQQALEQEHIRKHGGGFIVPGTDTLN